MKKSKLREEQILRILKAQMYGTKASDNFFDANLFFTITDCRKGRPRSSASQKMKLIYAFTLLFTTFLANAQLNPLRIRPHIALPKDSIESKSLTASINNFLDAAQKPNEENKFIFENEKIETFILLDEINGIDKIGKNDILFNPYLTNVVPIEDNNYLIQVSYIRVSDGAAIIRATFEFIAHKTTRSFLFSSPLLRNTKNWKVEKAGNHIFHCQYSINQKKVKEFNALAASFDLKLKVKNKITDYYCCDNIIDILKQIGVAYKADYNGRTEGVLNSSLGDRQLIVLGNRNPTFNEFDPHDLFHDRLSLAISRSKVNKPVDEGCAYLYGGSWGMSWKEIFRNFKEQIAIDKNTNWAEVKETPAYFKTKGFNNSADDIVNALLVQKIEKEKGFAGVWELLNVGPFEKGNEKYYQTLGKLTGITKANYNDKVWELINNETMKK